MRGLLKHVIRRRDAIARGDFAKLVADVLRAKGEKGDYIQIPWRFDVGQLPGREQASGLMYLKLLRFFGECRTCFIHYTAQEAKEVAQMRETALGFILQASGTVLIEEARLNAKGTLSSADLDLAGPFDGHGALLGYLTEDMRTDDAHSVNGLLGLKQLSDAERLCGRSLPFFAEVEKAIKGSPDTLFPAYFASERLETDGRMQATVKNCKAEIDAAKQASSACRRALTNKRVVIVEDENLWASAIEQIFSGYKKRTLTVEHVKVSSDNMLTGLHKAFTNEPVALCIVDVRLQPVVEERGIWQKVIREVRSLDPGVPILVLSSSRRAADRVTAMALDTDAFFTKDMGITPWDVVTGAFGHAKRSLEHFTDFHASVQALVCDDMALVNKWAVLHRMLCADRKAPWWLGYRFVGVYEDRQGQFRIDRYQVRTCEEHVLHQLGVAIARYRRLCVREALMRSHGLEPDPLEGSLQRANLITQLGGVVESVHGMNEPGADFKPSHLGCYMARDGTIVGRGDHTAQQLFTMRNHASHVDGMRSCSNLEWHAFFAGMVTRLYATAEFPSVAFPDRSMSFKRTKQPWMANEHLHLTNRLASLIESNEALLEMYNYLITP